MVRFYLTDDGVVGLREYQYIGHDGSFASVLMMPYWDFLVYLLPRWVAPNLLTIISFFSTTCCFLLFCYFHPNVVYEGDESFYLPLCVISAFFVFVNQTLDAIDGKQARRTGNSTGLGELFDHGLDSITTAYISFIACCLMEHGNSYQTILCHIFFGIVIPMPSLEEYVTGCLRLGSKYNDTTALLLFLEFILIMCGIFRGSFLRYEIKILSDIFGFEVLVSGCFTIFFGILTVFNVLDGWKHIFEAFDEREKEMEERGITKFGLVLAYLPFLFYSVLYATWCFLDFEFYKENTLYFCVSFAACSAYTAGRIIFCRATQQSIPNHYLLMATTLMTFVLCQFNDFYKFEIFFIGVFFVNGFIIIHFYIFAGLEMADALDIDIFSIKFDKMISKV